MKHLHPSSVMSQLYQDIPGKSDFHFDLQLNLFGVCNLLLCTCEQRFDRKLLIHQYFLKVQRVRRTDQQALPHLFCSRQRWPHVWVLHCPTLPLTWTWLPPSLSFLSQKQPPKLPPPPTYLSPRRRNTPRKLGLERNLVLHSYFKCCGGKSAYQQYSVLLKKLPDVYECIYEVHSSFYEPNTAWYIYIYIFTIGF